MDTTGETGEILEVTLTLTEQLDEWLESEDWSGPRPVVTDVGEARAVAEELVSYLYSTGVDPFDSKPEFEGELTPTQAMSLAAWDFYTAITEAIDECDRTQDPDVFNGPKSVEELADELIVTGDSD